MVYNTRPQCRTHPRKTESPNELIDPYLTQRELHYTIADSPPITGKMQSRTKPSSTTKRATSAPDKSQPLYGMDTSRK